MAVNTAFNSQFVINKAMALALKYSNSLQIFILN
jgi:hypothetical protein